MIIHPTGTHLIRRLFESTNNISIKENFITLFKSLYTELQAEKGSIRIWKNLLNNICGYDYYERNGLEAWKKHIMKNKTEDEEFLSNLNAQQEVFKKKKSDNVDDTTVAKKQRNS